MEEPPLGQLVQQPAVGLVEPKVGNVVEHPFPPEPPVAPVVGLEQLADGDHRVGVAGHAPGGPGQARSEASCSEATGAKGADAQAVGPKAPARRLPGPPVSLPDQLRQAELLAGYWNGKAEALRENIRRQQAAKSKAKGGKPGPGPKKEDVQEAGQGLHPVGG